MDERKILIVNLSRGLVGEDNAALLGALLVTKVQLGAMSRADIHGSERTPFYLYVDEFQNFATDSFATILSEARKYGLNLTVANQYVAQMMPNVRDAVFGNVGSIVGFRMSADDAGVLKRYFEPKFEEHDLIHMHNRHFVISMTIEGEKVPAFSAISLNLPAQGEDHTQYIIDRSRAAYASSREYVDRYMHDRYSEEKPAPKNESPKAVQQPVQAKPVTPKAEQPVKAETLKPAPIPEAPKKSLKPSVLAHAVIEAVVNSSAEKKSEQEDEVPLIVAEPSPVQSDSDPGGEKPKRRRRRRKSKSGEGQGQNNSPASSGSQSAGKTPAPRPPQPKEPQSPVRTSAPQEISGEGTILLK